MSAAVASHAGVFAGLLADADARVRAAAAYGLAQCAAPAAPLWDRWAAEEVPEVRASLALALGERDPDRSARVLAAAVLDAVPPVRVAAALALARNQEAWPDGAVAAVITAADDGAGIEGPWCRQGAWADELMVVADGTLAAALLAQMVTAARAKQLGPACPPVRGPRPAADLPLHVRPGLGRGLRILLLPGRRHRPPRPPARPGHRACRPIKDAAARGEDAGTPDFPRAWTALTDSLVVQAEAAEKAGHTRTAGQLYARATDRENQQLNAGVV